MGIFGGGVEKVCNDHDVVLVLIMWCLLVIRIIIMKMAIKKKMRRHSVFVTMISILF